MPIQSVTLVGVYHSMGPSPNSGLTTNDPSGGSAARCRALPSPSSVPFLLRGCFSLPSQFLRAAQHRLDARGKAEEREDHQEDRERG